MVIYLKKYLDALHSCWVHLGLSWYSITSEICKCILCAKEMDSFYIGKYIYYWKQLLQSLTGRSFGSSKKISFSVIFSCFQLTFFEEVNKVNTDNMPFGNSWAFIDALNKRFGGGWSDVLIPFSDRVKMCPLWPHDAV